MTMWKNQNSPVKKLSPGGSIHASVRSTSSSARLRDLLAREELARLELHQIEATANPAGIRIEKQRLVERKDDLDKELGYELSLVQNSIQTSSLEVNKLISTKRKTEDRPDDLDKELGNETSLVQNSIQTSSLKETELMIPSVGSEEKLDDLDKEPPDGISLVQTCIQTSPLDINKAGELHLQKNEEIMKTEQLILSSIKVQTTSGAIQQTLEQSLLLQNKLVHQELPYDDGSSLQCMYTKINNKCRYETLKIFSLTQSMARLHNATKRASSRKDICEEMPARDGHYEIRDKIKMEELDVITVLPVIAVTQNLYSLVILDEVNKKLPSYLKFRWYDYAVVRENVKKEQLDREATYTATEEDEGGGVLRRVISRGAGTVAITGGWCYAQGGDCWRLE